MRVTLEQSKSGYAYTRSSIAKSKLWRKAWKRLANRLVILNIKSDPEANRLITGCLLYSNRHTYRRIEQ